MRWLLPALALLAGVAGGGITDPNASYPVPALTRPAAGASYVDPVFGTTIRRVSALSQGSCTTQACAFEVPTYSQLQAFNADDSLMLLTASDGYRVRRVGTLERIMRFQPWRRQLPRWDPTRPRFLIHFNQSGAGTLVLQQTDVVAKTTTNIHAFSGYKAIVGNPSFEELSRDGRLLAGYAVRTDDRRELFVFDLVQRAVRLAVPLDRMCEPDPDWGLLEPDWVAPSPLGKYLVVQWARNGTARCSGLETYDLSGRFVGRVVTGHDHGDLGVTAGGREMFLTSSGHPDDPNETGLAWYRLPGTATSATPHYVRLLDWKALVSHISCQGPRGACLITSSSWPEATCCRSGWQPFQQEVWLQYLSGGTTNYAPVLRLAHHRSSEQGYWAQPHATIARDGRFALFGSDWGIRAGQERVDPYLITLPSN
jgi:hypothetical protein